MNTEEKFFAELGARIRRLREEKSQDQKAFAFYCEIGRTQLYKIESGKTNPRLSTLIKIASGLNMTVSQLLEV